MKPARAERTRRSRVTAARMKGPREPVSETHHPRGYRLALPFRHFDTDAAGRSIALDGTPYKITVDHLQRAAGFPQEVACLQAVREFQRSFQASASGRRRRKTLIMHPSRALGIDSVGATKLLWQKAPSR